MSTHIATSMERVEEWIALGVVTQVGSTEQKHSTKHMEVEKEHVVWVGAWPSSQFSVQPKKVECETQRQGAAWIERSILGCNSCIPLLGMALYETHSCSTYLYNGPKLHAPKPDSEKCSAIFLIPRLQPSQKDDSASFIDVGLECQLRDYLNRFSVSHSERCVGYPTRSRTSCTHRTGPSTRRTKTQQAILCVNCGGSL